MDSSVETSLTGTSHQDSLSGAAISGSVSTWITVVRSLALATLTASVNSAAVAHPDHLGAEAGGVGGQVDRQLGAVEPAVVAAVAVGGAEPLRAQRLRERADGGEAVVLHQHDDDLDALLHGGDQFGGHHQVRAVADHDEHVAVRVGHLGRRCRRRPRSPCRSSRIRRDSPWGRGCATACAGRRASSRRRTRPRRAGRTACWPARSPGSGSARTPSSTR